MATLLDQVRDVCLSLADAGWDQVVAPHGLNLQAPDLLHELTIKRLKPQRTRPGFEDFAVEGDHAVEPGHPGRSLLYHALASPNVLGGPDDTPQRFPTLGELDLIENFIFGVAETSLDALRQTHGHRLGIVVFAYEYRPGPDTGHRRHADLCFARSGVARVGTHTAQYDTMRRGFVSHVDGEPHGIRVLPARYGAFLAVHRPGSSSDFCPMRFLVDSAGPLRLSDDQREFWVPVHKLFGGSECLRDRTISNFSLAAHHVNEKVRRVHLELRRPENVGDPERDTGWERPDIDLPPFRFTEGIARILDTAALGRGLLMPDPHPLSEPALRNNQPLYFKIPAEHPAAGSGNGWFSSSLEISSEIVDGQGIRRAPEYVNVRHRLLPSGQEINLNTGRDDMGQVVSTNPDVIGLADDRTLPARHYIDWTGDGWVEFPIADAADLDLPRHAAYSLVTAPDFFPNAGQRELTEWVGGLPSSISNRIWTQRPPLALSDQRYAANLQLRDAGFDPFDDTITAIVSGFGSIGAQAGSGLSRVRRHSALPDNSAGMFQPGWEVSIDRDETTQMFHFAAYGLGSPFPEDAKLCAALSTFWPGVAPDATRQFSPVESSGSIITVAPLTDDEVGISGNLAWDGVPGPRLIDRAGTTFANYPSFAHVDYVDSAIENRFTLALTAQVTGEEYEHRILAMFRVYQVLARKLNSNDLQVDPTDKAKWLVLSFRQIMPGDPELQQAQLQSGTIEGTMFRFDMARNGTFVSAPDDPRRRELKVQDRTLFFAGALKGQVPRVLMKPASGGAWASINFGPV